jgi:hypothetical protein
MHQVSQQTAHVRGFGLQSHVITFTEPRNTTVNMIGHMVLLQPTESIFCVMLFCRFADIEFYNLIPQSRRLGLVVRMLASGSRVREFKPGRSCWIFSV